MTRENIRCIALLSYNMMMLLERILDGRIRAVVAGEIGEEQLEFRQGRRTTDGMFAQRQLMEKKLEGQEDVAIRFIDLEKAYAAIPREMTMATLR